MRFLGDFHDRAVAFAVCAPHDLYSRVERDGHPAFLRFFPRIDPVDSEKSQPGVRGCYWPPAISSASHRFHLTTSATGRRVRGPYRPIG